MASSSSCLAAIEADRRLRPPRRAERRENVEAPAGLLPARLDHGLQALRRRIETAQDSVEDAVPELEVDQWLRRRRRRAHRIGCIIACGYAAAIRATRKTGTEKPQRGIPATRHHVFELVAAAGTTADLRSTHGSTD